MRRGLREIVPDLILSSSRGLQRTLTMFWTAGRADLLGFFDECIIQYTVSQELATLFSTITLELLEQFLCFLYQWKVGLYWKQRWMLCSTVTQWLDEVINAHHEIATAAVLCAVWDCGRSLPGVHSIEAVVRNLVVRFSSSCWKILLSVFEQKIFYILTGSRSKFYLHKSSCMF